MISPLFYMNKMSISFGRSKSIFLSLNVKNTPLKSRSTFFEFFQLFSKNLLTNAKHRDIIVEQSTEQQCSRDAWRNSSVG